MSKKSKKHGFAYSTPPKTECHAGNVLVGSAGKINIFGGGHSRDCDIRSVDLAFDLARSPSSTPLFQMNSPALENPVFERLRRVTPVISILWPDYSVPTISRTTWLDIIEAIEDFAEQSKHEAVDVLFCCQGGHGRTGTALSIVCSLLGIIPENEDPVKWVRAKYCKKAVESDAQLNYLELIAGRLTKEEAYKEQSFTPPSLQPVMPYLKGGDLKDPLSIIHSAQHEIQEAHPDCFLDD